VKATVKIIGLDDLVKKFHKLGVAVSGDHLGKAALAGAMLVEQAAKLSMGEAKSGRMYGAHQASAPGEAPAVDTGLLLNSIQSELVETSATSALAQAGVAGAEYGEALEYGTARILPRPYMRPALDNNEDRIVAGVRDALEALVMGAAHG
jgi:HK97 gp10 family phage protein